MSFGFHKTTIIGRLGKDPELRHTESGKSVCSFSVAVGEKYGDKEVTTWYNCVAWEKKADICSQYLKKGSRVHVEGQMKFDKYEKDGQTRTSQSLNVQTITFLDSPSESQGKTGGYSGSSEEDIPF